MSKIRRSHAPQFKAKVALEALVGEKAIHEIAAKHQVRGAPGHLNREVAPVV